MRRAGVLMPITSLPSPWGYRHHGRGRALLYRLFGRGRGLDVADSAHRSHELWRLALPVPSRPLRATPTSSTSMTLPPRACSTARSTQAAPGGTTLRAWITEHSTASALTCSPARCAALLPTRSLWRSRVRTTAPRGRRGKIRSAGAIWQRSMPPGRACRRARVLEGRSVPLLLPVGTPPGLRAYRWNRDYGRPAHLRGGRQR